jgi:PAS domain S-box-containing protein
MAALPTLVQRMVGEGTEARDGLLVSGSDLRRSTPATVYFALAVFLSVLALIARLLETSYAFPAWPSYLLQFICLVVIAFGALEAYRVERRQMLAAGEVERLKAGAQRSERSLRELARNVPCGVYRASPDGRYIEVNPALARMLGCAFESELLDASVPSQAFRDPHDHQRLVEQCLATGQFEAEEVDWARSDGSLIRVSISGRLVRDPADASPSLEFVVEDLTARRGAEAALRDSEDRYGLLFERHPLPLLVFDARSLSVLAVNDAAVRQYGYSQQEFLRITMQDLLLPQDVPALLEELAQTGDRLCSGGVWRHRRSDGTLVNVEVSSHGLEFAGRPAKLITAYDVSERKKLEEQFRQLQKMEAIGRLAGGIAHDFNNLLAVIIGYCELLMDSLPAGGAPRKKVEEIRKASERGASLTRQLLAFSRKQVLEPRVLDLNVLLADLSGLLHRVIGEDIELMTRLDPELGSVKADRSQLEQVIMNLVANARDAMPQGGKLSLETVNVELDEAHVRRHPGLAPGRYVTFTVTDTGVGMDAQTQAHLFEPFFTTKEHGKGTGLGLATVYGIVRQSGGSIEVSSKPGRGSTFRIYLPWVNAAVVPAASAEESRPAGGAETILLVEDAEGVRKMTCEALERSGYRVFVASSSAEALELARKRRRPIHLLLTDVVMPGMNGSELAAQVTPLHPEAKVLYMSGHTDDSLVQHGVLEERVAFLQKPFTLAALSRKVREVLDGTASNPAPRGAACSNRA